ncbi:MAG: hypothetical protein CSA62_08880 [Planctomycetota bacterium]|nr:MAG: hypothetical protein CSA62_08880 [Planctomycetota bacterium]
MLLGFLLLTPLALRAPERDLPVAAWLRGASAVLLRPSLGFAELKSLSTGAAPPQPMGSKAVQLQLRLREKLGRAVLDPEVVTLFAQGVEPRSPVLVEVLEARARRSVGRRTLLELQLPHSEDLIEEIVDSPVVVGKSLVGFVQREPSAGGNVLVRSLADRPVRGTRQRVVAEARSVSHPELPRVKLVVEGAGAEDPHPLQAFLTTPRHLNTWSPGRFPFVAHTAFALESERPLPKGLRVGTIEDWGYLDRGFVLTRFLRPDWDARSLVALVLFVPPRAQKLVEQAQQRWALRVQRRVKLAWNGPAGLGFQRMLFHGPRLAAKAGIFCGDHLVAISAEGVLGLTLAERLGSRGQRLPILAELPGSDRLHALVVEGRGLSDLGSKWRIVWPEDFEHELLGARLFSGTLNARLPAGWRIGLVAGQQGRELEVQHARFDPKEHALFIIEEADAERGRQR